MQSPRRVLWETGFLVFCLFLGVTLPALVCMRTGWEPVVLPMQLCVLFCGLLCGPAYGLSCGALCPVFSNMIFGAPSLSALPVSLCLCALYGFLAGLLVCLLRSGWCWINVYAALIGAILLGRGIEGLLHAFLLRPGAYSWWIWAQESFVIPLPGLIIQLAVLPVAVLALWKLHPVLGPYGEH